MGCEWGVRESRALPELGVVWMHHPTFQFRLPLPVLLQTGAGGAGVAEC